MKYCTPDEPGSIVPGRLYVIGLGTMKSRSTVSRAKVIVPLDTSKLNGMTSPMRRNSGVALGDCKSRHLLLSCDSHTSRKMWIT